jgi:hypothetical protein
MTKNELINMITSLKIDLKYLKKDLQFRMEGNDVEGTLKKYKNEEHKYAYLSGTFQAMVGMDNDEFKRAIKSIEKMEKLLTNK